jgi:hypothetical protein
LAIAKAKWALSLWRLFPNNQELLEILKPQQNELNNACSAMKALNQMEKNFGKMEAILKYILGNL